MPLHHQVFQHLRPPPEGPPACSRCGHLPKRACAARSACTPLDELAGTQSPLVAGILIDRMAQLWCCYEQDGAGKARCVAGDSGPARGSHAWECPCCRLHLVALGWCPRGILRFATAIVAPTNGSAAPLFGIALRGGPPLCPMEGRRESSACTSPSPSAAARGEQPLFQKLCAHLPSRGVGPADSSSKGSVSRRS